MANLITIALMIATGGFLAWLNIQIAKYSVYHDIPAGIAVTTVVIVDLLLGFLMATLNLHIIESITRGI